MNEGVNLTIKELIELHGQVLASKMDRVERKVDSLQHSSDRLERGEFTEAQVRAIDARIDVSLESKTDKSWSNRERFMTVLSVGTALGALTLSVVLAFHGVAI